MPVLFLVLLAPLAVSGTGCLKRSSPDPPLLVSITPDVLDFGKVRPTDSPIKLTFDIRNNGRTSVVIADISSGCGCTIVDIPKEPIPANGKVAVTLRVNVSGRPGSFENALIVKTTTGTVLPVTIRGTVETDIWTDGQALRCTVGPKENSVSTVLTIYTAKYPDIVFADAMQEEGITLKEILRNTKDGETTIRFSVEVDVAGAGAIATRNIVVVPVNDSIAPLKIPLYCYRDGEAVD